MPHTDVPHLGILRSVEGKSYKVSVDAPRLASIQRGELAFALNVQIPMVEVTEVRGCKGCDHCWILYRKFFGP